MIKFLHTRLRVSDLEKSVAWYCGLLGFREAYRMDKSPSGNQIVLLELPGNVHQLELTYSPAYNLIVPEDLVHTCVGVDDISAFCLALSKKGVSIWPENWAQIFVSGGMKMAFLTDPDGYEVEILENPKK